MICPSTRLLMLAVLKAVTAPRPVRYTGTSWRCTGATATETARGPAAACAFCGLELLQPTTNAHTAAISKTAAAYAAALRFCECCKSIISDKRIPCRARHILARGYLFRRSIVGSVSANLARRQ